MSCVFLLYRGLNKKDYPSPPLASSCTTRADYRAEGYSVLSKINKDKVPMLLEFAIS